MNLPDLFPVVDATWPAAAKQQVGPWTIRQGLGGGSRVSAATTQGAFDHVARAEDAMCALGQKRLFMVPRGADDLDAMLAARGYRMRDESVFYAAPAAQMRGEVPPVMAFTVWPMLATQVDIWAGGGVGPTRLAVMERAAVTKVTFLGRLQDQPAGTVYAAISNGCAMIHALEVAPAHRRQGLAQVLTHAVARWAQDQGADWLTLITTRANGAANALYQSLGMTEVGGYHYRIKENADD